MPVVAQINVNFANLQEVQNTSEVFVEAGGFQQIDDKSVSPLTLAKYCLWNRDENENFDFGTDSVELLQYDGGFITAGDRLNIKWSDFQVRKNLDVGKNLYSEFLYSKRKNDNGESSSDGTYKSERNTTPRSITISPKEQDNKTNFIQINTTGETTNRSIILHCQRQSNENSIYIRSTDASGGENIGITSKLITLEEKNSTTGTVNINSYLNVKNDFKIDSTAFTVTASTGDTNIKGNLNVGSSTSGTGAYGMFTVDSSDGDTAIKGTLDVTKNTTLRSNVTIQGNSTTTSPNFERFIINDGTTGKFTVISASGNTDIQGTLNVVDNVTLQKNVTIVGTNSIATPETFKITDGSNEVFTVISANGNTDIKGTLRLDTNKFVVETGTGNTTIAGTLQVTSTSTFTNNITLNGGANNNSTNRRIVGARRLNNITEFNGTTYDEDVVTFHDFKKYGFKAGMVMMWYGDISTNNFNGTGLGVNTMTGWALCNGQNGTPDLRNKFVISAGYSGGYTYNTTGGTTEHNHGGSTNNTSLVNSHLPVSMPGGSTNNTGNHTHRWGGFCSISVGRNKQMHAKNNAENAGCTNFSDPYYIHELQERGNPHEYADSGAIQYDVSYSGSHSHSVTITNAGGGVGHNHSINNSNHIPPYYVLAYIMKT